MGAIHNKSEYLTELPIPKIIPAQNRCAGSLSSKYLLSIAKEKNMQKRARLSNTVTYVPNTIIGLMLIMAKTSSVNFDGSHRTKNRYANTSIPNPMKWVKRLVLVSMLPLGTT